jgi:hypothetical protein
VSLWLYKEDNKPRDWKKCIYIFTAELHTHLWLCCSDFCNPFKEKSFGCVTNHS